MASMSQNLGMLQRCLCGFSNSGRLVLIVITLVIGGISFFGFGWSIQNKGTIAAFLVAFADQ